MPEFYPNLLLVEIALEIYNVDLHTPLAILDDRGAVAHINDCLVAPSGHLSNGGPDTLSDIIGCRAEIGCGETEFPT